MRWLIVLLVLIGCGKEMANQVSAPTPEASFVATLRWKWWVVRDTFSGCNQVKSFPQSRLKEILELYKDCRYSQGPMNALELDCTFCQGKNCLTPAQTRHDDLGCYWDLQ